MHLTLPPDNRYTHLREARQIMLTGLLPEPPSYTMTMHKRPRLRDPFPPLQKFLRLPQPGHIYLQLLV